MTKTQYRKNCKKLKRNISKLIDENIEKILNSGAVDLKDYQNNYLLPKLVMCSIGKKISRYFQPPKGNREWEKEVKNIDRFL